MSYYDPEEIAARKAKMPWPDPDTRFSHYSEGRVTVHNPDAPPPERPSHVPGGKPNYRVPKAPCDDPAPERAKWSRQKCEGATPRQLMAMEYSAKGVRVREIAEVMGNTIGTIKGLLRGGRRRARDAAAKRQEGGVGQ